MVGDVLLDERFVDNWFVTEPMNPGRICRLRFKIEENPAKPRLIRSVRNIGYKLDLPEGETNVDASTVQSAPRSGEFIHDHSHVVAADAGMLDLMMTDAPHDVVGNDVLDLVAPSSHAAAQAQRFGRSAP